MSDRRDMHATKLTKAFATRTNRRYNPMMRGIRHFFLHICMCTAITTATAYAEEVSDPLHSLNRVTYALNEKLDKYVLRPVALGWIAITPQVMRDSLRNFDNNLRYPILLVNEILQGKLMGVANQTARFGINSTFGILGFREVAADLGFPRNTEDMGQTLGAWGIPPGPYLVIPLLGPSNFRDATGMIADSFLSVYPYFLAYYTTLSYRAVDVVNRRALFDQDLENTRRAALDHYVFLRNAYAQRREALIRNMDDNESQEEDLYDLDDEFYDIEDDEE